VAGAGGLAGADTGIAGLLTYPPRIGYIEHYEPLDNVYGAIADELLEDKARKLLEADLAKLKAELAQYGDTYRKEFSKWRTRPGGRDPSAKFSPPPFTYKEDGQEKSEPIEAYVKRFAEKRGLKYEGMKEPRSRADLFKEEGSTPLGSILKPLMLRASGGFGRNFEEETSDALVGARTLFEGRRVPEERRLPDGSTIPSMSREYALHWKVAEVEARIPPLEEVASKVELAWKLEKARELAEKAAKTLAEKANAAGADGYRLLKDSKDGEYLPNKTLARYETLPTGMGGLSYRNAALPVIEYPPSGVIDDALKKLHSPGDTMVVTNRPKSTYYVIFLNKRAEPKPNDSADIAKFDLEVMAPSLFQQIQVNGLPLSEFAIKRKNEEFKKEWEKYLKALTKFNEQEAERVRVSERD
jgi:hypothetical protein